MATAASRRTTFLGLLLISLSTLMLENLLTRIFSVTMWYHFAFVAVSVALFGGTVGALIVFFSRRHFSPDGVHRQMTVTAILFSISTVLALGLHTSLPLRLDGTPSGLLSLAAQYLMISVPFMFSGICVTLGLTRFPEQVSRLYAADLMGAAAGCLFVLLAMSWTDGPTAAFLCAAVASLGAVAFGVAKRDPACLPAVILSAALLVFVGWNTHLVRTGSSLLRLRWAKGVLESPPLAEVWNPISRLAVRGDPDALEPPFGFGISPTYPEARSARQLHLTIDSSAETILTGFDGDLETVDYLRYDVTNLAYWIRPGGSTLVVGSGGGRDLLSALSFGEARIVGVELNQGILDLTTGLFGDFTGHLERAPGVTMVQDEARSYISRSPDRFDIIQISLVDTFAAMSSGAYVLTENSLYTVEAFQSFMDHLSDDGVLTISRWYQERSPVELYRLTSLATQSLLARGVHNPRAHLLIFANVRPGLEIGIATLLMSPSPFGAHDIERIGGQATSMEFDPLLTPETGTDPMLVALASPGGLTQAVSEFPFDITAPTDERPFFFFTASFRDLLSGQLWSARLATLNMIPVYLLGSLLVVISVLAGLCILLPFPMVVRRGHSAGLAPHVIYFSCIGLGYILIELAQMQRLTIFLGHPTYSLSVVLFTLLVASGLGSLTTRRIDFADRSSLTRWAALLAVLAIGGLLTSPLLERLAGAPTWMRIGVSMALLLPMGLVMGMALPIGMKAAAYCGSTVTPWLWGVNGAMSVLGSVLAVSLSLEAGISTSYWAGFVAYLASLGGFIAIRAESGRAPQASHPNTRGSPEPKLAPNIYESAAPVKMQFLESIATS
jgi:hypothetical protein